MDAAKEDRIEWPWTGSQEVPSSLKQLADYLGLAPATVSLVLNGSAVADTISPDTKKLILDAARKFNYRPNFFARCLRTQAQFHHWRHGVRGQRRL